MDVKVLKEASYLKWRPDSFEIPVCDPNNAQKVMHVDLMEHMMDKPKYIGRTHKVSYFPMDSQIHDQFYFFIIFQKDNNLHVDKRMQVGRQLVDFLNDATCRNNGHCLEVSQNKLNEEHPLTSCRCKRALKPRTIRSLMKETTTRQPNCERNMQME